MYDVYKIPLEKLYNRKCRIPTIKGDNSRKKTPNDNTFYRKEGIYHKQIVLFYVHFAIFMYYERL
jgi:hypothetical protein